MGGNASRAYRTCAAVEARYFRYWRVRALRANEHTSNGFKAGRKRGRNVSSEIYRTPFHACRQTRKESSVPTNFGARASETSNEPTYT